jgi:hypothetical protein
MDVLFQKRTRLVAETAEHWLTPRAYRAKIGRYPRNQKTGRNTVGPHKPIKEKNMLGFSKVQIIGDLGGTPEMKYLPSGDYERLPTRTPCRRNPYRGQSRLQV